MRAPTLLASDSLTIYLNDHLAGATFGRELALRTLAENHETEFADPLTRLAGEIQEDQKQLEATMQRLGVRKDRIKVIGGWLVEKGGRLKPNGRLMGYSPLSRLLELEGLTGGVHAKLTLWRTLRELAPQDPRLDVEDFDRLIDRADGQLEDLGDMHVRAARLAMTDGSTSPDS